jgi:hypothetical protein
VDSRILCFSCCYKKHIFSEAALQEGPCRGPVPPQLKVRPSFCDCNVFSMHTYWTPDWPLAPPVCLSGKTVAPPLVTSRLAGMLRDRYNIDLSAASWNCIEICPRRIAAWGKGPIHRWDMYELRFRFSHISNGLQMSHLLNYEQLKDWTFWQLRPNFLLHWHALFYTQCSFE